jgi:hypothetical protein
MISKIFSYNPRVFSAIVVATLLAVMLPFTVFAAVPIISIKEVKAGESVTVHGSNFPANVDFTVRLDEFGDLAVNGIIVGTINSGTGSFDATFTIPAELKNEQTIAIRMDGTGGWYSYNWFNNKTGTFTVPTTAPTTVSTTVVTGSKPFIEVIGVKANDTITVQARRFPANQTFQIRIGTFKNFFKDFVVVGSVNSGTGGDFQFSVKLPTMQAGVELFTVRVDSPQKNYAYNTFKNITSGTTGPVTNPTPGSTPVPASGTCQITSTIPTSALQLRADFDAVWTVKNTSGSDWDLSQVDYKFISGTRLHKYGDLFDLGVTVRNGETVSIRVDMMAPATAGTYATNWAIMRGGTTLCTLPISVTVR